MAVLERPKHEELRRTQPGLRVGLAFGEPQCPQNPSETVDRR